jgi:hypothetical protein
VPFRSQAQRGYLYANNPSVAAEFEAATPKGVKLPQYAPKNTAVAHEAKKRHGMKVKPQP